MIPAVTPRQGQGVETGPRAAEAPACLTTTLYEVIAALQTVAEPDEDDLVAPSRYTGDVAGASVMSGVWRTSMPRSTVEGLA